MDNVLFECSKSGNSFIRFLAEGGCRVAMCDHCWKQSEAERRGSSVGGEAGSGVRGPVPGRGEEAGNKKSPFAKEEQRGNVNTGSFRMSSGAVHVALAISVGSKSGAGHRGFRPAGKQDRGRVPVPGRGEKADDKKSPFAKGGQRGNVNTGSFRMSSGAVHVALAISAGSKSGAGHWGSSVGGEPDWVSGFRYRAAAKRQAIKNPPLPKGDKGGMSIWDFSRCGTGRAAMGAAFAISAGSKSGAGHRKNPSVRGCCSPGSGGRAP